jgi:hypothetical protein
MCSTPYNPLSHGALRRYESGHAVQRLAIGVGHLELVHTQELVKRYLPPPPAVISDVGGGPGIYACWIAGQGDEVHPIDAVPLPSPWRLLAAPSYKRL